MTTRAHGVPWIRAFASNVCVALGLLATAAPCSSQGNNAPREGEDLARALEQRFQLGRRAVPGEVSRFLVQRENRTVDRRGATIGWTVAEGVVERTLLEEVDPGRWLERAVWKRFAFAEVQGSAAKPEAIEVPEAAGTAFTATTGRYEPGAWPEVATPIDGRAGSTLVVLGLDALTWDAFAGLLRQAHGELVTIGSRADHTGGPTALAEVAPGTRYALGDAEVTVSGVTVIGEDAALLLQFAVSGSRVAFEGALGGARFRMEGTEYFTGWGAFSLADGRILEGELRGPLISTSELGTPGAGPAELPLGGAVQRVRIRALPPNTG